MYFDHLVAQPLNRALSRLPPCRVTARVLGAGASFPRLAPSLLTAPPLTQVVSYGLQYETKDPTKIGYTLSIQQQIASQTAITVAYAGAHSYHQLNGNNGNDALPTEIRNGRKYFAPNSPARNPNLGQLQFWVTPEGASQYHSLQLGLNRRFRGGFQLQGSYTYAKSTNNCFQAGSSTEFSLWPTARRLPSTPGLIVRAMELAGDKLGIARTCFQDSARIQ